MKGVFVSHATADRVLVDEFVDTVLRLGCEVPRENIFYSARGATGIPAGQDLNTFMKREVAGAGIVIAILTPAYQSRPYCIAELGAAWSRTDVLFPIAVPDLERTDLQGVLKGMAVGYLDNSEALDELHDSVREVVGGDHGTQNWNTCKAKWLTVVESLLAAIPKPRIITPQDFDRVSGDRDGAMAALAEARQEVADLREKIEQLKLLKNKPEVDQILIPKSEVEQYEQLEGGARETLRALKNAVVRDAVYWDMRRSDMPWPRDQWEREEVDKALTGGLLVEGWAGDGLRPNEELGKVKKAVDAIRKLSKFISSDERSEGFHNWFYEEHDQMPADLTLKDVWDNVFNL